MKKMWMEDQRVGTNFSEMGLAKDVNKAIAIPSYKKDRLLAARVVNGFLEEELDEDERRVLGLKKPVVEEGPKRGHVVQELEQLASERADPEFR